MTMLFIYTVSVSLVGVCCLKHVIDALILNEHVLNIVLAQHCVLSRFFRTVSRDNLPFRNLAGIYECARPSHTTVSTETGEAAFLFFLAVFVVWCFNQPRLTH